MAVWLGVGLVSASSDIAAAAEQLELLVDALDVREQQRRGVEPHVMTATDDDLRQRAVNALRLLGARP